MYRDFKYYYLSPAKKPDTSYYGNYASEHMSKKFNTVEWTKTNV